MPPPSPGDDPLLLSGRPRKVRVGGSPSRGGLRGDDASEDEEEETMQLDVHALGGMEDLMDVSIDDIELDMDCPPPSTDFSDDDDDQQGDAMPLFDLGADPNDAGRWSDSDSDENEDGVWNQNGNREEEGEYTGRFRMMTVRTKADPPTSATRERMDMWGRPVR
jgi:hypothetical protein